MILFASVSTCIYMQKLFLKAEPRFSRHGNILKSKGLKDGGEYKNVTF